MSKISTFYYDQQLRSYIVQFMSIFAGMQVEIGKNETEEKRLIQVPNVYGHKDRVVAHIKGANTQNKPLRLPTFSTYLSNIALAPDLRKGVNQSRRNTYLKTGGLFPDDIEVVHQIMPVPYRINMELGIFASNTNQMQQILEQIMMLFDPILQIQTSDDVFDWKKITTVELTDIRLDNNYPSGNDRRFVQTTMDFTVIAYISAPADIRKNYIKDIYMRIGAVDASSLTNQEMVDDLDQQGIEYNLIASLDDINIDT